MPVGYYLGLYGMYLRLALKSVAQYRADFAVLIVSALFREGGTLLFLSVVFARITQLRGWSYYEVVLVFGLATVISNLNSVFLGGSQAVGNYVLRGRLDVLLVRPVHPLFLLFGEQCLTITGIGSLVVGVAIMVVALGRLGLTIQPWWFLYLPLVAVSGALVLCSISLIVACLAFRLTSVTALLMLLGYLPEFARYPLTIYARPLQFTLTWILPYALTGLLPIGFLLGKTGYAIYGPLAPLAGWLFLGLALAVWRFAIREYKSTGT
jgi:ABC-2 type transport system permease protein